MLTCLRANEIDTEETDMKQKHCSQPRGNSLQSDLLSQWPLYSKRRVAIKRYSKIGVFKDLIKVNISQILE